MTLATLILSMLLAGLTLIALGWVTDALHGLSRRRADRPRPLDGLGRAYSAPHFAARDYSPWPR